MEENPLWLVVLCDLMTNLMLFFLIMFSFTLQKPEVRKQWAGTFDAAGIVDRSQDRRAEVVVREFHERDAAQQIEELLRKSGVSQLAEVEVTQRAIQIGRAHV